MPTRTISDADRIDAGIARAERENREIDHGTARTIASQFHDGSTLTYSFVSTGAIVEGGDNLYRALFSDYASLPAQEKAWANWLGTYIVNRLIAGDTGQVDGWGNMWWVID